MPINPPTFDGIGNTQGMASPVSASPGRPVTALFHAADKQFSNLEANKQRIVAHVQDLIR